MVVFLPGQGSCSLSLAFQLAPVAPKHCFNFAPILRRYGSKHEKIDWKEKNIIELLFDTLMLKEKQAYIYFFPVVDTNKVS